MERNAYRLDSVAPALTERLHRASPALRSRAALLACELAVKGTTLEDALITAALACLRSGAAVRPEMRRDVEALVNRLDDEYFRLGEGDEAARKRSLELFSKARAAAAVFFTLAGDVEGACEGVYEAIKSGEDDSAIARPVEELLRQR